MQVSKEMGHCFLNFWAFARVEAGEVLWIPKSLLAILLEQLSSGSQRRWVIASGSDSASVDRRALVVYKYGDGSLTVPLQMILVNLIPKTVQKPMHSECF